MDSINTLPGPALGDAPESAVAKLSHRHDQLINWLLENPHRSLRECADHFNYSQSWVSQLIHSDIFQAQLRARQEAVFVQVAQDIPTKLKGLADQAIEKVAEILERNENPDLVVDIFDKTLNRLGYAPQKGGGQSQPTAQVNVYNVSREELAMARQAIGVRQPLELSGDTHSNTSALGFSIPEPAAIPSSN